MSILKWKSSEKKVAFVIKLVNCERLKWDWSDRKEKNEIKFLINWIPSTFNCDINWQSADDDED